jgi:rhodanese-related sulfurtransferase
MQEINATDAAQRLTESPDTTVLLDVREAQELAIAQIVGAIHIPMGEIPARLAEIDTSKTIICMCHGGMRSAQVAGFLTAQGYEHAIDLTGGIHAWSQLVDTDIPTY